MDTFPTSHIITMHTHYALSLPLAFFFFFGAQAVRITFTNDCSYTVWPIATTAKYIDPSITGFELASGASDHVDVPSSWSGRFWARTGCSAKFTCATMNCSSAKVECNGIPPVTFIELSTVSNIRLDFYDVSIVDGFNVPVSIAPQGGGNSMCKTSSCPANINEECPAELQVVDSFGNVTACKSACLAFNQPQYCCTGSFNSPDTCHPTNYSKIFKRHCPDAYSYPYDDETSAFSCSGGLDYTVTFCPKQPSIFMCIFHGSS